MLGFKIENADDLDRALIKQREGIAAIAKPRAVAAGLTGGHRRFRRARLSGGGDYSGHPTRR